MTKAQALACYGTPKTRTLTDEGERWGYFGYSRNLSEVPFKPRFLRTGTLFFGPDGKVKQFDRTPTKEPAGNASSWPVTGIDAPRVLRSATRRTAR